MVAELGCADSLEIIDSCSSASPFVVGAAAAPGIARPVVNGSKRNARHKYAEILMAKADVDPEFHLRSCLATESSLTTLVHFHRL